MPSAKKTTSIKEIKELIELAKENNLRYFKSELCEFEFNQNFAYNDKELPKPYFNILGDLDDGT